MQSDEWAPDFTAPGQTMDNEFEELRQEFLSEAADKLAEIRRLCEGGVPEPGDDRAKLMNLTHQLKGAGGSYGYNEISRDAASMELELEGDAPVWDNAEKFLASLEELVQRERKT